MTEPLTTQHIELAARRVAARMEESFPQNLDVMRAFRLLADELRAIRTPPASPE